MAALELSVPEALSRSQPTSTNKPLRALHETRLCELPSADEQLAHAALTY
jgi:hypothetical protein